MRKLTIAIFLAGITALTLTGTALATTTVSFSPATVNLTEGQSFSLTIKIDPQAVKNYTAKIELEYPADLLKVNSFTFGSNWMGVNQPGYDSIDNVSGLLIKTAGYPGGFSSQASFGTVSFSAKKAGNGVIKIGDNSLVLDAANQNLLSGSVVQTSFSINPAPVVVTPEKPSAEEPGEQPTEEQPPAEEPQKPQEEQLPGEVQPESKQGPEVKGASLLATVADVLSFGTGNNWLIVLGTILVVVIVLMIIFFASYLLRKSKNKGIK